MRNLQLLGNHKNPSEQKQWYLCSQCGWDRVCETFAEIFEVTQHRLGHLGLIAIFPANRQAHAAKFRGLTATDRSDSGLSAAK